MDTKSRKSQRIASLEDWRRRTEDDAGKSQEQFDKALMALSGSGIGATMAFLDKIVPFPQASLKLALYAIWLLWGLCLAATVFSFFSSTRALSRAEREIAKEIKRVRDAEDPDSIPGIVDPGGRWNGATKILNLCAAILFGFGLLALLVFIGYNLLVNTPKPTQTPPTVPNTKGITVSQRPPSASPQTQTQPGTTNSGSK